MKIDNILQTFSCISLIFKRPCMYTLFIRPNLDYGKTKTWEPQGEHLKQTLLVIRKKDEFKTVVTKK